MLVRTSPAGLASLLVMVVRGGLRLFGLVAVVGMALAGCTGDPEPIVTQTPTPTLPVESPSPTVSAAPGPDGELTDEELLALMPPEAAQDDLDGAIATAEFFLEQYAAMMVSGDTAVWDALSDGECAFCLRHMDYAASILADGSKIEGSRLEVLGPAAEASFTDDMSRLLIVWNVRAHREQIIDVQGQVLDERPAERLEFSMVLEHREPIWVIVQIAAAYPEEA